MEFTKFTLVTVITEPVLAAKIKEEILEMGSSGVTTSDVEGEGSRHLNSGEIPGGKIKIECVVDTASAQQIMEHVAGKYFGDYSVILYSHEVQVLRPQKFKGAKK